MSHADISILPDNKGKRETQAEFTSVTKKYKKHFYSDF